MLKTEILQGWDFQQVGKLNDHTVCSTLITDIMLFSMKVILLLVAET
jgi:hypothetical protein